MNPKYSRYYTFIKPILRNKVVRTYYSLTFSLIAIMIFSIFAIRPTISTILVLRKTISDQRLLTDQLVQKEKNLSLGDDNLNKIDQNTKIKLENLLPRKTDLTALTDSLTALARQNQASISGLQVQPVVLTGETQNKTPQLKTIEFTVNLIGSYQNLLQLLQNLKQSSRLISVNGVNLTKAGDNLIMSINAKAYFLE